MRQTYTSELFREYDLCYRKQKDGRNVSSEVGLQSQTRQWIGTRYFEEFQRLLKTESDVQDSTINRLNSDDKKEVQKIQSNSSVREDTKSNGV